MWGANLRAGVDGYFFPFFFSTSSAFLDSEIPFYSLLQEEK